MVGGGCGVAETLAGAQGKDGQVAELLPGHSARHKEGERRRTLVDLSPGLWKGAIGREVKCKGAGKCVSEGSGGETQSVLPGVQKTSHKLKLPVQLPAALVSYRGRAQLMSGAAMACEDVFGAKGMERDEVRTISSSIFLILSTVVDL